MSTKPYIAPHGVQLDAAWQFHRTNCDHCHAYNGDLPHTAASLCLKGSGMLKELLAAKPPPAPARVKREVADLLGGSPTTNYRTTKKKARELMRYKE